MSKRVLLGMVAAALIASAFALSCGGKSSSPTAPAGGGGGGAPELSSGNIAGGGMYAHTFNTAGTYNYHCTIHGLGMAGSVTVLASSAPTSASMNIVNNAYQNPGSGNANTATIMVGGTVTWTNTGVTHTVTSN